MLDVFDFLLNTQYYLKCVIDFMYWIELNVLFSDPGCKLYDHLLQIRFAK